MKLPAIVLLAVWMLPAETPLSTAAKERVSLIPSGAAVEVRTFDRRKLRGRIGVADDTGFDFQRLEGTRLIDERIPFDRVQSVKELKRGRPGVGMFILGMLATVGGLFLVSALVYVLGGD